MSNGRVWLLGLPVLFVFWLLCRLRRDAVPGAGFLEREAPIILWLRSQTGWPKHLGLKNFPHSNREVRGVASAADTEAGEVVLGIPEDRLLCAATNINLTLDVISLARESGSVFSAYLDSLPTLEDYKHWHPFYAPPELLERFEILPAVGHINAHLKAMNESYVLFGIPAGADWDTWQWAQHVVLTRNFGVEGRHCLVPGADLLNSAQIFNVLWNNKLQNRSDGKRYFEMKAIGRISRGEEMVTTYGLHRDNQQLFWQYGFFMEHNGHLITSLDPGACLSTPNFHKIVDRLCDDSSIECGLQRTYIGCCAYSIGYSYEHGLNGTLDPARARKWYAAALSEGDESAREKIERHKHKS